MKKNQLIKHIILSFATLSIYGNMCLGQDFKMEGFYIDKKTSICYNFKSKNRCIIDGTKFKYVVCDSIITFYFVPGLYKVLGESDTTITTKMKIIKYSPENLIFFCLNDTDFFKKYEIYSLLKTNKTSNICNE